MLRAAGHEADLVASEAEVADRAAGADVVVVDLTTGVVDGARVVDALRAGGETSGVRTLAFYSHVEADVRAAAIEAGFDQVVPRSRMAREGGDLVTRLAAS